LLSAPTGSPFDGGLFDRTFAFTSFADADRFLTTALADMQRSARCAKRPEG
jgi:hypothetical protein